jgi:hypothetical protein
MKFPLPKPALITAVLFVSPLLLADAPPQLQVTFVQASAESWNIGWDGVSHRIYTIQASHDLVNWMYAPVFEFGLGLHESEFWSNADKAFVRLKYEDHPEVETLEEAKLLSLDGTGMPGEWKVKNGLDPFNGTGISGRAGDLDGDGIANESDARPKDAGIGEAVISITSPANGSTVN